MAKIYTKTGDGGFTYTKIDAKTPKNNLLVHCLGNIDELNSCVGVLFSSIKSKKSNDTIQQSLKEVMNVLFHLGSFVGYGTDISDEFICSSISFLEDKIDQQESKNASLKNFILPTGCMSASLAHVARSVCRRAERSLYDLEQPRHYNKITKYLNRLSDYFFSLARTLNRLENVEEIVWISSK
jgi:cob(I)alamin adenosyltransferase